MASATEQDIRNLAWTMLGEAFPGDTAGMSAVGNTVLNRLNAGNYGSTITSIVKAPNQYAAWGIGSQAADQGNDPDGRFPVGSPEFDQAYQLAQQIVAGNVPDNTGGAVDYRQTTPGTQWSGNAPGTIAIGGNTFQAQHPVPPMNVPAVASEYADTTLPGAANPGVVPLAASQPFNIPSFNPFTAGDELALDPVTSADAGGATAPQMDAGLNPATGQVQPYTTPNAMAAMQPNATSGGGLAALPSTSGSSPNTQSWQDYLTPAGAASGYGGYIPGAGNAGMPSGATYTGQGIAGTAQLPAGVRPNIPSTTQASETSSASNGNGGWDSLYDPIVASILAGTANSSGNGASPYGGPYNEIDDATGGSSVAMNDPGYGLSALPAPSYSTQYSQQINPAYTAWMNNQTPTSPFSNPGVQGLSPDDRDSATGIAGPVPGLTSSVFDTPAPAKYISVARKVPAAASGLAALPVAQVVATPMTPVQQLQAKNPNLTSAQAYNQLAAQILASQNQGPTTQTTSAPTGYFGSQSTGASTNGFGGGAPGGLAGN